MTTPYDGFTAEKTVKGWRFTDGVDGGAVYEWESIPIEPEVSIEATPLAADGFHYEITVTNKPSAKLPIVMAAVSWTDWHDMTIVEYRNPFTPHGWEATSDHTWKGTIPPGESALFAIDSNLGPDKLFFIVSGEPWKIRNNKRQAAYDQGVPLKLILYSARFIEENKVFRVADVLKAAE
jgi:hypothetical protein